MVCGHGWGVVSIQVHRFGACFLKTLAQLPVVEILVVDSNPKR